MTDELKKNERQYCGLDLMRFICAYLVVAIHVPPFKDFSPALNILFTHGICRVAVPFFFVVSGFFCFKRAGSGDSFQFKPALDYALKILKLYAIWTLVYFPVKLFEIIKTGQPAAYFKLYIRDIIFTGSYTQLWYLNALVFAVIAVAILKKLGVSTEVIMLLGLVLYATGLLFQSYFGLIEPLMENAAFCSFIKGAERIIVTTRNGLFEGILFVSLGAWLSEKELRCDIRRSALILIVSIAALLAEVFAVNSLGLNRANDMFIMLIPCAVSLFMFGVAISPKLFRDLKRLRSMSGDIFYVHLWVLFIINYGLPLTGISLGSSLARFIICALVSSLIAFIIDAARRKV